MVKIFIRTIGLHYYWKGMTRDIQHYVNHCNCIRPIPKPSIRRKHGKLHQQQEVDPGTGWMIEDTQEMQKPRLVCPTNLAFWLIFQVHNSCCFTDHSLQILRDKIKKCFSGNGTDLINSTSASFRFNPC